MWDELNARHQTDIDEIIKRYGEAREAKTLPEVKYYSYGLEQSFQDYVVDAIEACGAEGMLARLYLALFEEKEGRSHGRGAIQIIFVDSENDLPEFKETPDSKPKKVWGHAGRYVTVFALRDEQNTEEGRRRILGRLFHEIRARSRRARELFQERLPATKAEVQALQEEFERDSLAIQAQAEETGTITDERLRKEFAHLGFDYHPQKELRDYTADQLPDRSYKTPSSAKRRKKTEGAMDKKEKAREERHQDVKRRKARQEVEKGKKERRRKKEEKRKARKEEPQLHPEELSPEERSNKLEAISQLGYITDPELIADIIPSLEEMTQDGDPVISTYARRILEILQRRLLTAEQPQLAQPAKEDSGDGTGGIAVLSSGALVGEHRGPGSLNEVIAKCLLERVEWLRQQGKITPDEAASFVGSIKRGEKRSALIEKLATTYRRGLSRKDDKLLAVVHLPVANFGHTPDGRLITSHVALTRGTIWIAAGTNEEPRSEEDIELDCMHELDEYNQCYLEAESRRWRIGDIAIWRDNNADDLAVQRFFHRTHKMAWDGVADECDAEIYKLEHSYGIKDKEEIIARYRRMAERARHLAGISTIPTTAQPARRRGIAQTSTGESHQDARRETEIDEAIEDALLPKPPHVVKINDIRIWKRLQRKIGMEGIYTIGYTVDIAAVEAGQWEGPGAYWDTRADLERYIAQPEFRWKVFVYAPFDNGCIEYHERMHYAMFLRSLELGTFISRKDGRDVLYAAGTESKDVCRLRDIANQYPDTREAFADLEAALRQYPPAELSQELFAWLRSVEEYPEYIGQPEVEPGTEEAKYLEEYMKQTEGTTTIMLGPVERFMRAAKEVPEVMAVLRGYYENLQVAVNKVADLPGMAVELKKPDEIKVAVVEPITLEARQANAAAEVIQDNQPLIESGCSDDVRQILLAAAKDRDPRKDDQRAKQLVVYLSAQEPLQQAHEMLRGVRGQMARGDDLGLGVTQSKAGILPHRREGNVNYNIIEILGKNLRTIAKARNIKRGEYAAFEGWYKAKGRDLNADVPQDKWLPIEKLATDYIKIGSAQKPIRLWIVELPVDQLGEVQGVPFTAHIGFTERKGKREAVMWVAAKRDQNEVELDIMHEEEELLQTYAGMRNFSFRDIQEMAEWRDDANREALDFFRRAHVLAWEKVVERCEDECAEEAAVVPFNDEIRKKHVAELRRKRGKLEKAEEYLADAKAAKRIQPSLTEGIGVVARKKRTNGRQSPLKIKQGVSSDIDSLSVQELLKHILNPSGENTRLIKESIELVNLLEERFTPGRRRKTPPPTELEEKAFRLVRESMREEWGQIHQARGMEMRGELKTLTYPKLAQKQTSSCLFLVASTVLRALEGLRNDENAPHVETPEFIDDTLPMEAYLQILRQMYINENITADYRRPAGWPIIGFRSFEEHQREDVNSPIAIKPFLAARCAGIEPVIRSFPDLAAQLATDEVIKTEYIQPTADNPPGLAIHFNESIKNSKGERDVNSLAVFLLEKDWGVFSSGDADRDLRCVEFDEDKVGAFAFQEDSPPEEKLRKIEALFNLAMDNKLVARTGYEIYSFEGTRQTGEFFGRTPDEAEAIYYQLRAQVDNNLWRWREEPEEQKPIEATEETRRTLTRRFKRRKAEIIAASSAAEGKTGADVESGAEAVIGEDLETQIAQVADDLKKRTRNRAHQRDFPPSQYEESDAFIERLTRQRLTDGKDTRFSDLRKAWRQEQNLRPQVKTALVEANESLSSAAQQENMATILQQLQQANEGVSGLLEKVTVTSTFHSRLQTTQSKLQAVQGTLEVLNDAQNLTESVTHEHLDSVRGVLSRMDEVVTNLDPDQDTEWISSIEEAGFELVVNFGEQVGEYVSFCDPQTEGAAAAQLFYQAAEILSRFPDIAEAHNEFDQMKALQLLNNPDLSGIRSSNRRMVGFLEAVREGVPYERDIGRIQRGAGELLRQSVNEDERLFYGEVLRIAYIGLAKAEGDKSSGAGDTAQADRGVLVGVHRGIGGLNEQILERLAEYIGWLVGEEIVSGENADKFMRDMEDEGKEAYLDIDKEKCPSMQADNGTPLAVVEIPAKELASMQAGDGKALSVAGHIGLRNGIIWVATDGDKQRVQLTKLHEREEYNVTADPVFVRRHVRNYQRLSLIRPDGTVDIERMADWRDGKFGNFNNTQRFFHMVHREAWRRVARKCKQEAEKIDERLKLTKRPYGAQKLREQKEELLELARIADGSFVAARVPKTFEDIHESKRDIAQTSSDEISPDDAFQRLGLDEVDPDTSKAAKYPRKPYVVATSTYTACLLMGDDGAIGVAHIRSEGPIRDAILSGVEASSPIEAKQRYLERVFEDILPADPAQREFFWRKVLILTPKPHELEYKVLKNFSASTPDFPGYEEFCELRITHDDIVEFITDRCGESAAPEIRRKTYKTLGFGGVDIIFEDSGRAVADISDYETTMASHQFDLTEENFDVPVVEQNYYTDLAQRFPTLREQIDQLGQNPTTSNILAGVLLGAITPVMAAGFIAAHLDQPDIELADTLVREAVRRANDPLAMAKRPEETTEKLSTSRLRQERARMRRQLIPKLREFLIEQGSSDEVRDRVLQRTVDGVVNGLIKENTNDDLILAVQIEVGLNDGMAEHFVSLARELLLERGVIASTQPQESQPTQPNHYAQLGQRGQKAVDEVTTGKDYIPDAALDAVRQCLAGAVLGEITPQVAVTTLTQDYKIEIGLADMMVREARRKATEPLAMAKGPEGDPKAPRGERDVLFEWMRGELKGIGFTVHDFEHVGPNYVPGEAILPTHVMSIVKEAEFDKLEIHVPGEYMKSGVAAYLEGDAAIELIVLEMAHHASRISENDRALLGIRVDRDTHMLEIIYLDDGEEDPQAAEEFGQFHEAAEFAASGYGPALLRHIAENLRATIGGESEEYQGTRIMFSIPLPTIAYYVELDDRQKGIIDGLHSDLGVCNVLAGVILGRVLREDAAVALGIHPKVKDVSLAWTLVREAIRQAGGPFAMAKKPIEPTQAQSLEVKGRRIPVTWYGPDAAITQQWKKAYEYVTGKHSSPQGITDNLQHNVNLVLELLQSQLDIEQNAIMLNLACGKAPLNNFENQGVTVVNIDNERSHVRPLPSERASEIGANYTNCDLEELPEHIDRIRGAFKPDGHIQFVGLYSNMIEWLRGYTPLKYGISEKMLQHVNLILKNAWTALESKQAFLIVTEPGCENYIASIDLFANDLDQIIIIGGEEGNFGDAKAVVLCRRAQSAQPNHYAQLDQRGQKAVDEVTTGKDYIPDAALDAVRQCLAGAVLGEITPQVAVTTLTQDYKIEIGFADMMVREAIRQAGGPFTMARDTDDDGFHDMTKGRRRQRVQSEAAERGRQKVAYQRNAEDVLRFLRYYRDAARVLGGEEEKNLLNRPVSIKELHHQLCAFLGFPFREEAFFMALCHIGGPMNLYDEKERKTTVVVSHLLYSKPSTSAAVSAVADGGDATDEGGAGDEMDRREYSVARFMKEHSSLIPQGSGHKAKTQRVLIRDILLGVTRDITHQNDRIAAEALSPHLKEPDMALALAMVRETPRMSDSYIQLNANQKEAIDRVNEVRDPVVADILARFTLGGMSKRRTITALTKHLQQSRLELRDLTAAAVAASELVRRLNEPQAMAKRPERRQGKMPQNARHTQPIEALLIDVDGTLYTVSPELHAEIDRILYETFARMMGMRIEAAKEIFDARQRELNTPDEGAVYIDFGFDLRVVDEERSKIDISRYSERNEELVACLRRLKEKYRLVAGSNGGSLRIQKFMEELGLSDIFEKVFTQEDLGVRKPDPAFFGAVLEYLGLRPEQVASIGDHAALDTEPAQAMGMKGLPVSGPDELVGTLETRLAELQHLKLRQQWAQSLTDSIYGQIAKLKDGERLGVVIDTSIGNLDDHAYELIRELEDMAERDGLKGKLDILTGEGPILAGRVNDYLRRNKTAQIRGVINTEDQRRYISQFQKKAEFSQRIKLVAVDDTKTPNTDSANLHYIALLPIIESSLAGTPDLTPIPHTEAKQGGIDSIITSIRTLLPAPEPVPMYDLELRFKEDAGFLRNA